MMDTLTHASPSAPLFVLRGHRNPIHCITFCNSDPTQSTILTPSNTAASTAVSRSVQRPNATHPPPLTLLSGDSTGCVMVWNLTTRRSVAKLSAHTSPVLAIHALTDGKIITQGKDGFIRIWNLLESNTTPIAQIETGSYTFFKSQLTELKPIENQKRTIEPAEEQKTNNEILSLEAAPAAACSSAASSLSSPSFPTRPLLLVPCEEASCLALYDLAHSLTTPVQLVELEARIPRDPDFEERVRDRLTEKEAQELEKLLAQQPQQYERKVGMAMAAKFFRSTSAPSSGSSSAVMLDDLAICWAAESGIIGVWECSKKKQLFKQPLHKETILSFDLNFEGSIGVSTSSGSKIHAFRISLGESCFHVLGEIDLPHEGLTEVVLRADGRLFGTAGWDHRVRLFDCSTLQPLAILREHTETVQCIAMPSGSSVQPNTISFIASGAKDGKIAVYQIYSEDEDKKVVPTTSASSILQKHEQLYQQRHGDHAAAPSTHDTTE